MEQRPRRKHNFNLYDLGIGNDFLGVTPKAKATKVKINCACKKKFFNCASKNIIKKIKNLQYSRKYFQITSDKGLVSRI